MTQVVRIHEYGNADVLRIDDIDVPAPAADEIQIRVKAIGLNRAEVMFRNGAYLQEAQFPSRLGYEAAGVVEAVGSAVSGFTAVPRSAKALPTILRPNVSGSGFSESSASFPLPQTNDCAPDPRVKRDCRAGKIHQPERPQGMEALRSLHS